MSTEHITVLNGLTIFSGNPKPGESTFASDIDARTFLRSLENHFENTNVTDDNKKIQIMFSLINKTKGDAIRFMSCYTARPNLTFDRLKMMLLRMYPSFKHTEFKPAARALLATNLTPNNMFCGMTILENLSRAAAEAYVNNVQLTKKNFNANTTLSPPEAGLSNVSPASLTEPSTSHPSPPELSPILLTETLQNFAMHLFIATQTHTKVYEKLLREGPEECSTLFMANTIEAFEKFKMTHAVKKQEKKDEAIWKLEQIPTQNRSQRRLKPGVIETCIHQMVVAINRSVTIVTRTVISARTVKCVLFAKIMGTLPKRVLNALQKPRANTAISVSWQIHTILTNVIRNRSPLNQKLTIKMCAWLLKRNGHQIYMIRVTMKSRMNHRNIID